MKFLLLFLLFYGIYRLIINVILPILNLTGQASKHIRKMQDQINTMQNKSSTPEPKAEKKAVDGDYIDYEEIK